ncbi:MAG: 23S rRNA (adenine(2503)-C(2))-methyltransferase RlmN [Desulfovibrio sp.]
MRNLLDMTYDELEKFIVEEVKQPKFRAGQIWQWLWQKGAGSIEEMTNLSKDLRAKLAEHSTVFLPEVDTVLTSEDGTIKFLLNMADGEVVEAVLIPAEGRYTLCLSTQVGCAMSCSFCSTGLMGFTRNLTQGEILGQVLVARKYLESHDLDRLKNLVFMGMGEPLMNFEELMKSLKTMKHEKGLYYPSRRIMVSSVGFYRHLEELAETDLCRIAISLHAPNQTLRKELMPKAANMHIEDLMATLRSLPLRPREKITLEYLMLDGVNDSLDQADELAALIGKGPFKVNLIAFNPPKDEDCMPYKSPSRNRVIAFEKRLWKLGVSATLRKSKGQDIAAACGQLKADKLAECEAE